MQRVSKRFEILPYLAITFVIITFTSVPSLADDLNPPDPGKKIKVFILAGQSNMEGRADGALVTPEHKKRLQAVQDRVQLAYNRHPISSLNVVKPVPGIAKSYNRELIFGPEFFFGIELAEQWPDEKILLIKRTQGGTSLHGCWNPDWSTDKATHMDEQNDPKLYQDLIAYVAEVLSEYNENEYELCAMLWVQGESDSSNEIAANAYEENLKNLIASSRRDVGRESLPFILFQVGRGEVVEAMRNTADEDPNVILIPQSSDPKSQDFYDKMENGHYNYSGMTKLGRRFMEVFLTHKESR